MNNLACYLNKLRNICSDSWHVTRLFICCCCNDFVFRVDPFLINILYPLSLSLAGFGIFKVLKPRTTAITPRNIDLFFTSVSVSTLSSMSTVEMEVFSDAQLIVMIILIFMGGKIFTSMIGLHFKRFRIIRNTIQSDSISSTHNIAPTNSSFDQTELSIVTIPHSGLTPFDSYSLNDYQFLKYDSIRFLGFVVLGYFLLVQILGIASVLLYLALVSSARDVLRNKGLKTLTFIVFTVVSTFASCGFVPTNENMMVFSKNSGLLWILIPQALLGNTLFPSALRAVIWVLGKKFKKAESEYLLKNTREAGYLHLLPRMHSVFLVATIFGFILIGFLIFCSLEWNSAALSGLNTYQKIVGILFQCVNARHSGETIVDLSAIAPAIWVFFVVMMYLPPYTSFLPTKRDDEESPLKSDQGLRKKMIIREAVAGNLIFSQLSYVVMFIILVCLTERKSMKDDPINFSVFNIIVEVVSAYGNVGFSTGYSCERQLRPDPNCVSKWYGFSGKWSDEGKIILIIVMFFGRLKKFNMNGDRPWKLM